MKDPSATAPPVPALDALPIFVEQADDPSSAANPAAASPPRAFGVFTGDQLQDARTRLPTSDLDWGQVVELRRQASEQITEESGRQQGPGQRPLAGDDRVLMGRAVIRRVVADHVRALHRDGAELWSSAQEHAYVVAVEDAVFGFGRLQPLLDMPDVENIEIHGWDSVVVQYGDGRREQMPPVADSDEELVEAIRFLGQNAEPSRPFRT